MQRRVTDTRSPRQFLQPETDQRRRIRPLAAIAQGGGDCRRGLCLAVTQIDQSGDRIAHRSACGALADIGLGYPVLRKMLLELGRRFEQAGAVARPDDIFWLTADEVQGLVADPQEDATERVAERQATHEVLKGVTPPPMLPQKKKFRWRDPL